MIRCVIIDDEPPARDELAYILSEIEDVDVVGEAGSASTGIETVRSLHPDLVFLDIQMPGRDGFQVLQELRDMDCLPYFVFATAFEQYAVKAFDESATDYILKPFSAERVRLAVQRVKEKVQDGADVDASPASELTTLLEQLTPHISSRQERNDAVVRIPLESGMRNILVEPRDVVRFSVENRRVLAHLNDTAYYCPPTMKLDRLQERLQFQEFFRANRGELVNMRHIREYAPWVNGRYVLVLDDEQRTEVSVSRGRIKELRERLGI